MNKKLLLTLPLLSLFLFSCNTSSGGSNPSNGDGNPSDPGGNTPSEPSKIFNVNVAKVDNISDDFIRGFDASSIISLEDSGVKFYDYNNKEEDLLKVLADNGVNYIRVRIWNDPYNDAGKGYGGGNNDVAKAVAIGKRATSYGMKLLVDFHYSDCWADPLKYVAPKAWQGMNITQKANALSSFTTNTLNQLKSNNIDVGMVQIGNEINSGLAGETYSYSQSYTNSQNYFDLLKAASNSVRGVYPKSTSGVKIAVHYTDPQKNRFSYYSSHLNQAGIDYDVFGASYYRQYHGAINTLVSQLNSIASTYNKEVMILETSYPYTSTDSDGEGNSYPNGDYPNPMSGYAFSTQGQVDCYRDLCNAMVNDVNNNKGIGVCYWEGAWISVGSTNWNTNNPKWDQYGSGWISRYAKGYDVDADDYSRGSCMDNQAFFDAQGKPLDSLAVFKYLKTGYTANVGPGSIEPEQKEEDHLEVYLSGTFNSWAIQESYKFSVSSKTGYAYELLNKTISSDNKLKAEANNWSYEWNYAYFIENGVNHSQSISGGAASNFSNANDGKNNILVGNSGTFNFYITNNGVLSIEYA